MLTDKKEAAVYRSASFTRSIGSCQYRLLVVRSSSLDKRKLSKLNNLMEQTKLSLEKQVEQLAKESFYCAADAHQALAKLTAIPETRYYPVTGEVEKVITLKHSHRGRPKKVATPEEIITYRAVPRIHIKNEK